jgi:hypothetical protein
MKADPLDRTVIAQCSSADPIDLTPRSQAMGRDECLCFANKAKDAEHPTRPDFRGTIRLSGAPGHYYYVALWKNKNSFSVSFTPWHKTSHTGVAPVADLTPVKIKLLPTRSGDPVFSGETRRAVVELRPALCSGKPIWWLKLIPKKQEERAK